MSGPVNHRAELEKVAQSPVGARMAAIFGGPERFVSLYSQRTFSPDRQAFYALESIVDCVDQGTKLLRDLGADEAAIADWQAKLEAKWIAREQAGARTLNWMITGPARFPVARNEKAMATERKRVEDFYEFYNGVGSWWARRQRSAERALLSETAKGQEFETVEVAGVKLVKNTTIDRVQLIFPGKPDEETRRDLKGGGFRWSPREGAWQRQLTRNGIWAAQGIQAALAAEMSEGGAA